MIYVNIYVYIYTCMSLLSTLGPFNGSSVRTDHEDPAHLGCSGGPSAGSMCVPEVYGTRV